MSLNEGKWETLCGQRWIVSYLISFGLFCVMSIRVNISVALLCMVTSQPPNSSEMYTINKSKSGECTYVFDETYNLDERAEFEWDSNTQSNILASYFYGYILTQIPGGWLSDRFGGRLVFGVSMLFSGISNTLLPVCARTSVYLVYVSRVISGLSAGVVYPASCSILGRWAARLDRTKMLAVAWVGGIIGIIVTFASSGVLCVYSGWESIFYISGGLTLLWVMLWFYQVRDSPVHHPRISEKEREYIAENIEFNTAKRSAKVPVKEMITSVPFWALLVCHMCHNWAEYTLLTSLPSFMKGVLKFDIQGNGLLSSLPYICTGFMTAVVGHIADYFRTRGVLTTTQTRKIFQSIAFVGSGIFLVATGFVPCSIRELAVVLLCCALVLMAFYTSGFGVNHIDLAPKYGGVMFGLTNTAATIPGIVSPLVTGSLTPHDTQDEWKHVFYVGGAFNLLGTIVFTAFGSGELQPWARDKIKESKIIIDINLAVLNDNKEQT